MGKLILTRGLPGSGKTTWAEKWVGESSGRVRVNRDDTRWTLFGRYSGLTHAGEEMVTKVQQGVAVAYLSVGLDVVIDDTNLNASTVRRWQRVAAENNADFSTFDFWMEPHMCVKMVALRASYGGRDVPTEVINKMYDRYLRNGFPKIEPLEAPHA